MSRHSHHPPSTFGRAVSLLALALSCALTLAPTARATETSATTVAITSVTSSPVTTASTSEATEAATAVSAAAPTSATPSSAETTTAATTDEARRTPVSNTAQVTALYLDGQAGHDDRDGATKETAVLTFARAKALATANRSITTIYVMGTVAVSGPISLDGTNAVVKREPSFDAYLFQINKGDQATLSAITIDGNQDAASAITRRSLISVEGALTLENGARLQNNAIAIRPDFTAMGGALFVSGRNARLDMNGGDIRSNRATYGGGVYLTSGAVMNMRGGGIII